MKPIHQNLYQFSTYIPSMDFTIHQYLLATVPAILFASGTYTQATEILPQIKAILAKQPLKYIFVSHHESDECGGLRIFKEAYPEVIVIASPLTTRELPGFGYEGKIIAGNEANLVDKELNLAFINYPSEVHLQDGLLCYEKNSGIFYSSDLMLRFGNGGNQVISTNWLEEVNGISLERIANETKRQTLIKELTAIKPSFVTVGHGFCLEPVTEK